MLTRLAGCCCSHLVDQLLALHLRQDRHAVLQQHLLLLRLLPPVHHLIKPQDDLIHRELVVAVKACSRKRDFGVSGGAWCVMVRCAAAAAVLC